MTTYCLDPNAIRLAVYNLNTGTMPTNNVIFSHITANLSSSATSIAITSGEGALFEGGMVATIEQLNDEGKATAREVVLISGISTDTLTLTRGYEKCVIDDTASPKVMGNTPQSFTSGARISVYVSKALLNGVQTRLSQVNCPCNTCVYNEAMQVSSCVVNNCDDWRDKLYQAKASRCFNDCGFGDGSDGDCVMSEDTFLCANCNYNFKNLTICEGVMLRFVGAGTPRINVQRKFCNMGTIDLRGGDYVGACSKTDCITGCTVSNKYCQACYNTLCFGCGGCGGRGCYQSGTAGCNATADCGGSGGKGGDGRCCYCSEHSNYGCLMSGADGGVADGLNGGNGGAGGYGGGSDFGDFNRYSRPGGGGGGGGGYFTGNGGKGGNAGGTYKGAVAGVGGDGGNAGIFGRGGDGGQGSTTNNSCSNGYCAKGGRGGNGRMGGNGGLAGGGGGGVDGTKGGSGGDGGNGIVCGGRGADPKAGSGSKYGGKGGCAFNNMYGLILHACEYYNTCIQAQGGKGGDGGSAPHSTVSGTPRGGYGGIGGNGADGGNVSVAYVKLVQSGNINVSAGAGGRGGCNYCGSCGCCSESRASDGTSGTAGRCKICKPF